jgi:hypothetical protein
MPLSACLGPPGTRDFLLQESLDFVQRMKAAHPKVQGPGRLSRIGPFPSLPI